MKKWLIFIGGILTGIVLTVVLGLVLSSISKDKTPTENETEISDQPDGVTIFDEPGEIMNSKSYKVFQVVFDNGALVNEELENDIYLGTVFLLINDEDKYYYDDEIIKVPQGKVVRQIGIYKYPTKRDIIKTVPIIKIMDK